MRIVILGASGNAGREVARLLSAGLGADDELVLAGRDRARLAVTAAIASPPAKVLLEQVDLHDDAGVAGVVTGASQVVVTAAVPQRVGALAGIVLAAGADWIDTMLSTPAKLQALRDLEPRITAAGRCFVTDAGFHPGLPAAMVRWAAQRLDTITEADVHAGLRVDWRAGTLADSTVDEMLAEFGEFDLSTWVDGGRRRLRWSECPTVDFGPPIGRKQCTPMPLAEMDSLPQEFPTLRRCGFYVSGFSPAMDYLALPVLMLLARSPRLRPAAVRFARWSLQALARPSPPHRLALRLRATGTHHGRAATAAIDISGDDGYLITAAPVVACLRRLRAGGAARPGLWLQANLLPPDELFDDLAGLDLTVARREPVPC